MEVAPRAAAEPFEHMRHDRVGIGEPALPRVTAGQPPALGRDHLDAAPHQRGEVLTHRCVLPHLRVHGGTDDHRRPGGQEGGAQEVVGEPSGVPGEGVCRRRHNQHQVSLLAEHGVRNG